MRKFIILTVLLFTTTILNADTKEQIQKQIKKYSNNIGFIKGKKRDKLKTKFPMCDEFLDVKWFKKKPNKPQRGWRKYTYYKYKYDTKLDKYIQTDKKVTIYELVEIQKDGSARYYGLYFIKRAYPKSWKQVIQDMKITGNNKQFTFHYKGKKYIASKFKKDMAHDYLNVCLVKPDNKIALFYEMKSANKVLSDEEQEYYLKKINASYKYFDDTQAVMDINNDGMLDFVYFDEPYLIYSYNDKYFDTNRKDVWINHENYFIYNFLPNNKICKLKFPIRNIYYSISKNYLYVNQNQTICNLTKLTTQGGK